MAAAAAEVVATLVVVAVDENVPTDRCCCCCCGIPFRFNDKVVVPFNLVTAAAAVDDVDIVEMDISVIVGEKPRHSDIESESPSTLKYELSVVCLQFGDHPKIMPYTHEQKYYLPWTLIVNETHQFIFGR